VAALVYACARFGLDLRGVLYEPDPVRKLGGHNFSDSGSYLIGMVP